MTPRLLDFFHSLMQIFYLYQVKDLQLEDVPLTVVKIKHLAAKDLSNIQKSATVFWRPRKQL